MKVCRIYLKPGSRQEHDALLALDARGRCSVQGLEGGRLENFTGPGIRSSALAALAVLSLCLPPFARGQEPAVGVTNPPAADLSRRLVAPKSDEGGSQTEAETVVLPKSVPDPFEPFNRVMWGFNKGLMTDVIKPTSRVYRFVVVKPVRTGIGNFGRNLTYPGRLINNLLQGKWSGARDES